MLQLFIFKKKSKGEKKGRKEGEMEEEQGREGKREKTWNPPFSLLTYTLKSNGVRQSKYEKQS